MMKNIKRFIIGLVMIFVLAGGNCAVFAHQSKYQEIPGVKVYIDGVKFETKESFYNDSNTTLVPMREFFEKLGASLEWDQNAQKIIATTDEKTIELVINNKIASINGKDKVLSVEPKIINDHTYVPLRFVAEALMYEVDWNSMHHIISIIDMRSINEITMPKTYKSSQFLKTDYINMEIIDNESIKINGGITLDKTEWMFNIGGQNKSDVMKEYKKIKADGTYGDMFSLKNKLTQGEYKVSVYFKEKQDRMYWSYYGNIPLHYMDGEIFFPVSPVYANNYLEGMKNSVIDPKNYLGMTITNEAEKNEMIDLANKITKDATSDYDKLLKVNDWVAQNIYYNWDGYKTGTYGRTDAYGTLKNKKSVCQGYAELTRELLRAVGIPSRLVSGHALGVSAGGKSWDGVDHTESNHAWNEAFVENRWVIIDTTWNSGNNYEDGIFKDASMNYKYFDPSLENFSNTHKIVEVE